jgi:hypothetical protein
VYKETGSLSVSVVPVGLCVEEPRGALQRAGLCINLVLFQVWVNNNSRPRSVASASLAQSLIIIGGTLAIFGVLSRFQSARVVRKLTEPVMVAEGAISCGGRGVDGATSPIRAGDR